MRASVLTTTCDRCHVEEDRPLPRGFDGGPERVVLPEGWLHVSGVTTSAVVFQMDLCPECKHAVMSAAGAARRN